MLVRLLYIVVSFVATVIGSLTGIGGGIVLKTSADFFSTDSVITVSFYTTIVVFTMCIVSIYKQWRRGFKFDLKVLFAISGGSLVGGYIGEYALNYFTRHSEQGRVQLVQNIILFITLVFLLIYTKRMSGRSNIKSQNPFTAVLLGLFLGTISIFLGIGGGPLNVSLLIILFGYSMKDAAIYSIATVFFSQFAKIISITYSGQYDQFDLKLIPFLIVTAILGGYVGTSLNQKYTSRKIEFLYSIFMVGLTVLTLVNIFRARV